MLVLTTASLNKIRYIDFAEALFSGGLEAVEAGQSLEYEEAEFDIDDFSLLDSDGKLLDDENASSIIYKKIQFPSTAMSTDERIWATLSLGSHFKYSLNRWSRGPESSATEDVHNFVQSHFFCATARIRYRSNSLARLWWRRRYIDRVVSTDKQKAAHLFFSEGFADWGVQFLERPNLAAIPELANAIIDTSYERFVASGRSYDRSAFRGMLTKLDIIAGSTVPTLLSYDEIREAVTKTYRLVTEPVEETGVD